MMHRHSSMEHVGKRCSAILTSCLAAASLLLAAGTAWADGTETLGDPSIAISQGTGVVVSGVGLNGEGPPFPNATGQILVDVPGDAVVQQVVLYWSGQMLDGTPGVNDDSTVVVNGTEVVGTLIGGPAYFFTFGGDIHTDGYRADITNTLGGTGAPLVAPGANVLDISGLDYYAGPNLEGGNHGAGVLVIFDQGGPVADIQVQDGIDLAFCGFPAPRDAMVPRTFTFAPSSAERSASLSLFVGSVGQEEPPSPSTVSISFDVGGTTTVEDVLASHDGNFWDTLVLPVSIAAGATELTAELISGRVDSCPGGSASLNWVAAALEVPPPAICGDGTVDPGEECDDGNDDNFDGCRNDCSVPICGDGILDTGELCDDGNDNNFDGCRNDCSLPTCGDGIQDPGEDCDDGNTNDMDACRNNCTAPICGDGIKDAGEDCDDGNDDDFDGCRNDCSAPFCGDGVLDPGEECDDGNNDAGDSCSPVCTVEGGGQGCTPGYWRQPHHFDSWVGYSPFDSFNNVFGVVAAGDPTLLGAVKQGGGGAKALGRHAVAALLNSNVDSGVEYLYSTAEVIAIVQDAYATGEFEAAKNMLAAENELGCSLN